MVYDIDYFISNNIKHKQSILHLVRLIRRGKLDFREIGNNHLKRVKAVFLKHNDAKSLRPTSQMVYPIVLHGITIAPYLRACLDIIFQYIIIMHQKENRTVTCSSVNDPQDQKTCHPYALRYISCNYQAEHNVDLLDKLSGDVSPRFQPWFGSLTKVRASTEESQSILIFTSGKNSSSSEYSENVNRIKSEKVQMRSQEAKRKVCNCRRSHCMKNYCQCFTAGQVCSRDTCGCINCKNQIKSDTLLRNQKKAQEKSLTCNCKNNQCKNGYCDCFRSEKGCSAECQCVGCLNEYGRHVTSGGSERKLRHRNA